MRMILMMLIAFLAAPLFLSAANRPNIIIMMSDDMGFSDIVRMSFFLTRPEDMAALVEIRKELLDGVRPAITTLFVAGLVSPDWLVEVEATACAAP